MSITMPDNVVCTFDQMCLGVECCMHITLAIFRSSINVFARLDPKEMQFVYGVNGHKWTVKLTPGSTLDGKTKQQPIPHLILKLFISFLDNLKSCL